MQVSLCDTKKMNIQEVRRDNLAAIIHFRFDGVVAACARKIEKQASYISRLLYPFDKDGSKKMGEDLARQFELSLGLETYELDSRGLIERLVAEYIASLGWSVLPVNRKTILSEGLLGCLPDLHIEKDSLAIYIEVATSSRAVARSANAARNGELLIIDAFEKTHISSKISKYLDSFSFIAYRNFVTPSENPSAESAHLGAIDGWDDSTALHDDDVEIPIYKEVEMAAGDGTSHTVEINGRKIRFAKSSLRNAGVSAENAACATVSGDSMADKILDGATVGIDRGRTQIKDGKVYAIDHGGMLRIKYLHRLPGGGLKLRSHNKDYDDEDLTSEQTQQNVRILGWVFWWSQVDSW